MLLVNEIYRSLMGESLDSGRPCTIVRLTGCHRRCSYCDTEHSFSGGRKMAVADIVAAAAGSGCRTVMVTGGEPLLQDGVYELMRLLLDAGHHVVLETSGTVGAGSLGEVPTGVRRIVDVKTPGSGIGSAQIDWDGIAGLGADDELKFVCCDRRDYEWSRDLIRAGDRIPPGPDAAFSPCYGMLDPADLAEWILADGLDARLQIQLHKIIWPDRDRGV